MSAAQPWMKFYPRDWRADEKLRMCSLAARGLWMEMLALMHNSERYGQLLINGNVPTDAQLAVLAGAPAAEVAALLGELECAGVFSRTATGAIYSRRMTADERRAKTARRNGSRGGNPSLCKDKDNLALDNPKDKATDKDRDKLRGQRPESRGLSAQARATPIPEGWQPEPFGEGTKCRKIVDSWSADNRATQVEKFTAYHRGKGSRWKSWQDAWQTWVLNAPEFSRTPATPRAFEDVVLEDYARRQAAGAAR